MRDFFVILAGFSCDVSVKCNSSLMRFQWMLLSLILITGTASAGDQSTDNSSLLRDTATLRQVRTEIDHVFNFEFTEAGKLLGLLRRTYPEHPVTSFFEGLIYYWKYYPLMPDHPGSREFEMAMEESLKRAGKLKEKEQQDPQLHIEGVFFELMARSFLVMYYADNGKTSRAIGHLSTIYRDILQGFGMQQEFKEFYFITGLYNYYREAYPEAHPVYRPALIFFRKGDREEGLKMLRYAARETYFMKAQASLFLSIININYESNPDSALWYASLIHREYPGNPSFLSLYTEMLLVNRQYDNALMPIKEMTSLDGYNRMEGTIYMGIYEERKKGDAEAAYRYYQAGLSLAEPYGEMADNTRAYAYIGLSRYYAGKGDDKKAREYYKKAKSSTGYAYVFE